VVRSMQRSRARLLWIVLGLSALVWGCREQEIDTPLAENGRPSSEVPAEELQHLRSLGYLGYAEEPVDSAEPLRVHLDAERSYPGYNLYTSRNLRMAELINASGQVIKTWQLGKSGVWRRSVLLPDGDLLVIGSDRADGDPEARISRFLMRLDGNNELRWKKYLLAHHDIALTPDQRIMVLTFAYRHIPAIDPTADIRDNRIAILSQDGELLEEQSLYDMLIKRPDLFSLQTRINLEAIRENARFHGNWAKWLKLTLQGVFVSSRLESDDLFHANSLHWMDQERLVARHPIYALSNILVSMRHQDSVAIFDWEKRELVWVWGRGEISGPHDAKLLPNGNLLIFDNGLGRNWSRVIEMNPLTKEIVWEYKAEPPGNFYTASRGANQRLRNGNTLITESDRARAFEVTTDGEIVWEFVNPHVNAEGRRATIVRLYRLDAEFVRGLVQ